MKGESALKHACRVQIVVCLVFWWGLGRSRIWSFYLVVPMSSETCLWASQGLHHASGDTSGPWGTWLLLNSVEQEVDALPLTELQIWCEVVCPLGMSPEHKDPALFSSRKCRGAHRRPPSHSCVRLCLVAPQVQGQTRETSAFPLTLPLWKRRPGSGWGCSGGVCEAWFRWPCLEGNCLWYWQALPAAVIKPQVRIQRQDFCVHACIHSFIPSLHHKLGDSAGSVVRPLGLKPSSSISWLCDLGVLLTCY